MKRAINKEIFNVWVRHKGIPPSLIPFLVEQLKAQGNSSLINSSPSIQESTRGENFLQIYLPKIFLNKIQNWTKLPLWVEYFFNISFKRGIAFGNLLYLWKRCEKLEIKEITNTFGSNTNYSKWIKGKWLESILLLRKSKK